MLLLSLPPLVLVDKSPSASDVAALPLCCGYFFFDGSVLLSDSEVAVSADDLRGGGGMGLQKRRDGIAVRRRRRWWRRRPLLGYEAAGLRVLRALFLSTFGPRALAGYLAMGHQNFAAGPH